MTIKKINPFHKVGILMCLFSFFSCYGKKELKVLGFAYCGDRVTVKKDADTLLSFKAKNHEDTNSICFFYERVNLFSKNENVALTVVVDSSNTTVLDSSIIISKSNKEPFISLKYPYEKKLNKRVLFVADDSIFPKY